MPNGTVFQVIDGPFQLDIPGGEYGGVFTYDIGNPLPPFVANKREYWAIANGQPDTFDDETIDQILELAGVDADNCTDFVNYLRGNNGGPPPYSTDRVQVKVASVADRPDQFGSKPKIPGYTTSVDTYVKLTGTTGSKSYQGIMVRRVDLPAKKAYEYWLTNAPNGRFAPGETLDFPGIHVPSGTLTPKNLVDDFPNWLPNPSQAGPLSSYYFWYADVTLVALSSNPAQWQSQICG